MSEEKVGCRTPAEGRDGVTNIPAWKYALLERLIREVVAEAGEAGLPFSQLRAAVAARLSEEEAARLGSVGWHATCVKLEMEVRGDLRRLPGSPQRIVVR